MIYEPVAGGVSLYRVAWPDWDDYVLIVGCSLIDAPVGPMLVVVLKVFAEQLFELGPVPDDGPVQEFVAQGPHPPFGVRVCLG